MYRSSYKRYIIVGLQRSGTTLTHLCLRGHPNVSAVNDEVKISPLFTQGISTFTYGADTDKEKKESISALFDALASIEADENTLAIGMKIATSSPEQASKLVKALQNSLKDLTVILTQRLDLVAQYGSQLRAQKTGKYHSWSQRYLPDDFSVEISEDSFIQYAVNCVKVLEELRRLTGTHQLIEVNYEKDILSGDFGIFQSIFKALDLPQLPITWLDSKKVAPNPEDYILNYANLKAISDKIWSNQYDLNTLVPHNEKDESASLSISWKRFKNKLSRIKAILQE